MDGGTQDLFDKMIYPFADAFSQQKIAKELVSRMTEPVAIIGVYCMFVEDNHLVVKINSPHGMGMCRINLLEERHL